MDFFYDIEGNRFGYNLQQKLVSYDALFSASIHIIHGLGKRERKGTHISCD